MIQPLKKVRMFCDWGNDAGQLIERLEGQTSQMNRGIFKNLKFTTGEEYAYAVCFNYPAVHDLKCPSSNVVSLVLEPLEVLDKFYNAATKEKSIKEFKVYSFADEAPFESALGLGFSTVTKNVNPSPQVGRKRLCMIASNKRITKYHHKRHEVVAALLDSDIDMDFYGRGMGAAWRCRTTNDPRVKGEIPPMGKDSILSQYKFCIDFENSPNSVVTDKFFDTILCDTHPITNATILDEWFPDSGGFSVINFDHPVDVIVNQIKKITDKDSSSSFDDIVGLKNEFLEGKLCLANWIHKRVNEL
jgi:hypothetical protein